MSTPCWALVLEGLGPADHQGKLQSTCYLLLAAMAQVRTRVDRTGPPPHSASSPQDSVPELSRLASTAPSRLEDKMVAVVRGSSNLPAHLHFQYVLVF